MRGRREQELEAPFPSEYHLGATIRAWRRFRGMSVTDLAVAAGFGHNGRGYISKIEHQHIRRLGEEQFTAIARALDLSPGDLQQGRLPETEERRVPEKDLLDQAIAGCLAWLRVYHQDDRRLDHARIYFKLAQLYWECTELSTERSERGTLLTEALESIKQALLLFWEEAPDSHAEAQHLRSRIERAIHLKELDDAILGCKALLQVYSRETKALDWARTHTRLAQLYRDRLIHIEEAEERQCLVHKALHSLDLALPIFERDAPNSYIEIQRLRLNIEAASETISQEPG